MTAGIVNFLKPPGMTSHDVVSFARRIYGLKKVGHSGTLDPAAAGVLPVFLGTATRLIEYCADVDKAYRVEMVFGLATDTGDDTGTVLVCRSNLPAPSQDDIATAMKRFVGEIEQVPPMYSAIKVGGKKLYELARKGLEAQRPTRRVTISRLDLVANEWPVLRFDVTCSKGTYIRSLCVDIGEHFGYPATMSFLIRTRVGEFRLENAYTLEEVAAAPLQALLPVDQAIGHLPRATLSGEQLAAFANGQGVPYPTDGRQSLWRIYSESDSLAGIGQSESEPPHLRPVKVFSR